MRDVTLWMQVSLDGYTEGPDGAFDWPVVQGELHRYFIDELTGAGAFLYGRRVYEGMASFWPNVEQIPGLTPLHLEYGRLWVPMPKVVFSRTLTGARYNTQVAGGDLAREVAARKEGDGGNLVLFGGGETAGAFIAADLIDEYRLFVHPVVLGGGKRLFPALDQRAGVQLVEARTFDGAVVHLRYRRTR